VVPSTLLAQTPSRYLAREAAALSGLLRVRPQRKEARQVAASSPGPYPRHTKTPERDMSQNQFKNSLLIESSLNAQRARTGSASTAGSRSCRARAGACGARSRK
jgi:hypothetical protein